MSSLVVVEDAYLWQQRSLWQMLMRVELVADNAARLRTRKKKKMASINTQRDSSRWWVQTCAVLRMCWHVEGPCADASCVVVNAGCCNAGCWWLLTWVDGGGIGCRP